MTLAGAEADSGADGALNFATRVFPVGCWLPGSGGGGTIALCDHSWPFQPLFGRIRYAFRVFPQYLAGCASESLRPR